MAKPLEADLLTSGVRGTGTMILRLLAAGRARRTRVESPMRAATVGAMPGPRKVQQGARTSFVTPDRDDAAGPLDVVTGSEFLDDRVRLGD